jgi:hypothetical protein
MSNKKFDSLMDKLFGPIWSFDMWQNSQAIQDLYANSKIKFLVSKKPKEVKAWDWFNEKKNR